MSEVYMLTSVSEITLSCGTPVFNWCCADVVYLNVH